MEDQCDNCKKEWETNTMWFAYQFSKRVAMCNDCYIKAGRPIDYRAMREWLADQKEIESNFD